MEWGFEDLSTDARAAELAREASHAFGDIVELDQDVEWLRATGRGRGKTLFVLTAREGERLTGLAPFEVLVSQLQFALGGMTLWRKRVQRYAIEAGPLVAQGVDDEAVAACLRALAARLPENAVVFLRGVPEGSSMHEALTGRTLRSMFHVVPFGPVYKRCRIRWSGSFESYLASLGKVSRKDLRRTLKKTPKVLGVELRLVRYTRPEDVRAYARAAAGVSAKTYQAKLGLGLKETAGYCSELEAAARSGRLLGHVLFRGDEPIAFHLGFVDRGRLYMANGGYDPAWAKAQIGMFAFLKVLQDLETQKTPVSVLDYLYGDGTYKLRTSNDQTPERHYYLMPRTAHGALLAFTMRSTDDLSRGVGAVLESLGLKSAVKSLLRSAAGMSDRVLTRFSPRASAATAAVMDYMPLVAVV